MHYVTLGRTGLRVSVMGLGGGGHSRLGKGAGKSEHESVAMPLLQKRQQTLGRWRRAAQEEIAAGITGPFRGRRRNL